ncbi:hypothetical protein OG402_23325 [Streptomyces anulatus]|uniref:hypothetical protein n=1 Tax=Streptomyces anulatus TaxID=1892 RepID=UPI002257DDC4|nr:hypothetical protein [Streptomyces anulatus]MCX4520527.1 hypothetical protein [Streptomyces anulatus]MCX4603396.1 hypothetical protein [Streptomyces anulatus]
MELADIGAIAAAGVAAVGIPAALLVGRWQLKGQLVAAKTTREVSLRAAEEAARTGVAQAEATYRAALDTVRATAAANHDQWRRTVRRDAYVQLVLASAKVEQTSLPESDAATTLDSVGAAEDAVGQALHQVVLAYYVVRLESPDLKSKAIKLLKSTQFYAQKKMEWAAYSRARSILDEIEAETHAILSESRDALTLLHETARALPSEQRGHSEVDFARRHAERALSRVPQLSERHIRDLVEMQIWPPEQPVHRLRAKLATAREEFVVAAQEHLELPA